MSNHDQFTVAANPRDCSGTLVTRGAFSLLELCVAVAIVMLVASIGLSLSQSMLIRAKSFQCLNNLRNLGMGVITFPMENHGCMLPVQVEGTFNATSWNNGTQWDEWLGEQIDMPPRSDGADAAATNTFPSIQCPFDRAPKFTDGLPMPVQRRSYSYNWGHPFTTQGGAMAWDWSWLNRRARPDQLKDRDAVTGLEGPFVAANTIILSDYVRAGEIGVATPGKCWGFGGGSWYNSTDWGTWNPLHLYPPSPSNPYSMTAHARGGKSAVYYDGHASLFDKNDTNRYYDDLYYVREYGR